MSTVLLLVSHSVPSCTYSPLSFGGATGLWSAWGREASDNSLLSLGAERGSGWVCSRANMDSHLTSSAPLVTTSPFPSSHRQANTAHRHPLCVTKGADYSWLLETVCVCVFEHRGQRWSSLGVVPQVPSTMFLHGSVSLGPGTHRLD